MEKYSFRMLCVMLALYSTLLSWGADFVANGIKYSINGASVTVIANTEKYSGDIVIPSTVTNGGNSYIVVAIGSRAFDGCSEMTSITISEGIERIGNNAFEGCNKLKTLTLPNSITEVGNNLAVGCDALTTVTIGDGLKVIASEAFYRLGSLETVNFGSKVEEIGLRAFSGCKYLQNVELPEKLRTIGNSAFASCQSFTNIVIPASVRTIGYRAFEYCTDMTEITINEGVEKIDYCAFEGCNKLKTLTLPNSIIEIGNNLAVGCDALTTVTIGDGLKVIASEAFYRLGSLETVNFGSKVDEIGLRAFSECNFIKKIQCLNTKPAVWNNLNSTFSSEIYSTCTLYVPVGSVETYKAADGWKNFFYIEEIGNYDEITIDVNGKRTYCSSSDLNFADIEGLKAYIASGYDHATGAVLLTRVEEVPAGTGIMLVGDEGTYQVPHRSTEFCYVNMLKGTLQEQSLPATENGYTNYVLMDGPEGVLFYISPGSIGANKAYLQVPSTTSQAHHVLRYIVDDEMETDIKQPRQEDAQQENIIYTLNGQRAKQLRKGIYIQKGKKIVIR